MTDPERGCGYLIILAAIAMTVFYGLVWWLFGFEWVLTIFLIGVFLAGAIGLMFELINPKK